MIKEKYEWMYNRMVANLCTSNHERKTFEKWFNQLCDLIDKDIEKLS